MRCLSVLGACVLAIGGCFEDAPPLSDGTGTTDAAGSTADTPTEGGPGPDTNDDDPSADVTTNDPSSSDGATTNDTADSGIPVTCGDGIVDPGEECDDADLDNDDACGMACRHLWLGTGADGPLDVVGLAFTDAIRSAIVSSAAANDDEIVVASAIEFAVGDEILIIQMTGGEAGMYETRRIVAADTTTGTLTVEPVLANSYVADIAGRPQAIRVPNYTDVTIAVGGILTAHPWDGATGGVVALRMTGELVVQDQGRIEADALGMRGGIAGAPALGGGSGNEGAGGSGHAEGSGNGDCLVVSAVVEAGGPGQFQPPFGGPAGPPGVSGFCVGSPGGIGGGEGGAGGAAFPGAPSESGASQGVGGQNATASLAALHVGGGGGGGDGGRGGVGAGGGGGGGGCNSHCNDDTEVNGLPGMPGDPGGTGGAGGQGGDGGGLVFVVAERIRFEDVVTSRGGDGLHGSRGGDGGVGGQGGAGGLNCGETVGGAGGGGNGGGGGDGGDGGGGGAGGTIVLAAYELDLGEMLVRAFGGDGGPQGDPGGGGEMGPPNGFTGPMGNGGLAGDPGADGRVIVRCPAPGCEVTTDPPATVLPFPR